MTFTLPVTVTRPPAGQACDLFTGVCCVNAGESTLSPTSTDRVLAFEGAGALDPVLDAPSAVACDSIPARASTSAAVKGSGSSSSESKSNAEHDAAVARRNARTSDRAVS